MYDQLGIQIAAIVSLLSLILYLWITLQVGPARRKYKIAAPAVSGHVDFERVLRVQANTLEQLVPFLVALWLCVFFLRPSLIAGGLGLIWLIGRLWYALGYYAEAGKRGSGFVLSFVATLALIVGALFGVARSFFG